MIFRTQIILYVADQKNSAAFYRQVLDREPTLDVPGMTEFSLAENCILGLMPYSGIQRLLEWRLPGQEAAFRAPHAEAYLMVDDPASYHHRALEAGAQELSALALRNWGDLVAYCMDLDGNVLAFARRQTPDSGEYAIATQAWESKYPDFLVAKSGDHVLLGKADEEYPGWIWCTGKDGKSGWAPESYLACDEQTRTGRFLRDYSAVELDIQPGDRLIIHIVENEWAWGSNQEGRSGWIPLSHFGQ